MHLQVKWHHLKIRKYNLTFPPHFACLCKNYCPKCSQSPQTRSFHEFSIRVQFITVISYQERLNSSMICITLALGHAQFPGHHLCPFRLLGHFHAMNLITRCMGKQHHYNVQYMYEHHFNSPCLHTSHPDEDRNTWK